MSCALADPRNVGPQDRRRCSFESRWPGWVGILQKAKSGTPASKSIDLNSGASLPPLLAPRHPRNRRGGYPRAYVAREGKMRGPISITTSELKFYRILIRAGAALQSHDIRRPNGRQNCSRNKYVCVWLGEAGERGDGGRPGKSDLVRAGSTGDSGDGHHIGLKAPRERERARARERGGGTGRGLTALCCPAPFGVISRDFGVRKKRGGMEQARKPENVSAAWVSQRGVGRCPPQKPQTQNEKLLKTPQNSVASQDKEPDRGRANTRWRNNTKQQHL